MAAKGGLGSGLGALFDDNTTDTAASQTLRISEIEPNRSQPRKNFDPTALSELAVSIKTHGLIQPILVTPRNGRYLIVAGERRFRASKLAEKKTIKAIIKDFDDNPYRKTEIRSLSTFWQQNRCVFEISKEQYEALVESIKVDVKNTLYINKNSQAAITKELKYDFTNNNCTTWALNKLDSIGIEIIDNEEWLPDNISTRDSLLQKFHYLQYLYAVFRKFQKIDSR